MWEGERVGRGWVHVKRVVLVSKTSQRSYHYCTDDPWGLFHLKNELVCHSSAPAAARQGCPEVTTLVGSGLRRDTTEAAAILSKSLSDEALIC